MLVEKSENLEVIEECLRECLGKEVRVKCFDEEDIVDTGKMMKRTSWLRKRRILLKSLMLRSI